MTNENSPIPSFEEKLKQQQVEHAQRLASDLEDLFGKTRPCVPASPRANGIAARPPSPLTARIDLTGDAGLRKMDDLFIETFQLRRYMPGANLNYPTVYAETLEEFFGPFVKELNLSGEGKAAALAQLIAEAERTARETNGGGIFGVSLPGRGCYLNGWLFAYGRGYAPRAALQDPDVLASILSTIAHEKLGHGFITESTALGNEKKQLGLAQIQLANRFNLAVVDSPQATLLAQKSAIIFTESQLTEEGWATWIETFLMSRLGANGREPHTLDATLQALKKLESGSQELKDISLYLQQALKVLFTIDQPGMDDVHKAIVTIQLFGPQVDEIISSEIRQPLRYAVGYLLMDKIAKNAGWQTAPFAVIIAANLTYDLNNIGPSDLNQLVRSDARMNVDSRLAMLSLLTLSTSGDVHALASEAKNQLSLAVPSWLNK
ncbi:MAG: hypothetical protein M1132_12975 [Chloroflexi bacterium]|nr:hypothetical protein [Chloroflexota bacterium]